MSKYLLILNDRITKFFIYEIKDNFRGIIEEDVDIYNNFECMSEYLNDVMLDNMWNCDDKYCSFMNRNETPIRINCRDIGDVLSTQIDNYEIIDWEEKLTFKDCMFMRNFINEYEEDYCGCDLNSLFKNMNTSNGLINAYCYVFAHNLIFEWSALCDDKFGYYSYAYSEEEIEEEFNKWRNYLYNYIRNKNRWVKINNINNLLTKYVKKINTKKIANVMLDKIKFMDTDIKSVILQHI